jgi:hypothetical protein
LGEDFFAFSIFFENERAVRLLKLFALYNECNGATFIQVLELGYLYLASFDMVMFARLLRLAGQPIAGGSKVALVHPLREADHVAAIFVRLAVATVPDIFLDVDGEPIVAAATWAGTNLFFALPL